MKSSACVLLMLSTSLMVGCYSGDTAKLPHKLTPETQAAMEPSAGNALRQPTPTPVSIPLKGTEAVRALQQRLSENGYYDGPINGIMNPETRKAAKGELQDRL